MNSGRYPHLSKVVAAALSIFHGPQVESSFNIMGDVIDAKKNRLNIETFSAIQSIKYSLRRRKTSAIDFTKREDPIFDPVNKKMCYNLRAAAARYKAQKDERAAAKMARKKGYKQNGQKSISKPEAKKAMEDAELKARQAHEKERNRARKRALQVLAEKRTAKKAKA